MRDFTFDWEREGGFEEKSEAQIPHPSSFPSRLHVVNGQEALQESPSPPTEITHPVKVSGKTNTAAVSNFFIFIPCKSYCVISPNEYKNKANF